MDTRTYTHAIASHLHTHTHTQRAEQSHAHVVLSADGDDDENWFQAAKAEEEAACLEAASQHEVLARVTVAGVLFFLFFPPFSFQMKIKRENSLLRPNVK